MTSFSNDMAEKRKSLDGQKKILMVGLACLDLVNVVDSYPIEDQDMRVESQRWCRGGNASNSSVVLSQLADSVVECLVTLSDKATSQIILQDLEKYGTSHENCVVHPDTETPTSVVIVNKVTGTRTILHGNRSLPELRFEDFDKLSLSKYKWIHFEGRNVTEVLKMIDKINLHNENVSEDDRITVSVEIEKPRIECQHLFPKGDVVFVSKDYARHQGYETAGECLEGNSVHTKDQCRLICAWGEDGAWGRDKDGTLHHSPGFPPERIVETLAAGDTFNAGIVFSLVNGNSLQSSLLYACRLAGFKCGIQGLDVRKFVHS
ncbi:ketohexokinase-like isoform X2 [Apostichopus japonicus]|uniref:ketohexokinase-like isoform X2 n=1 Tax=Stichopus japonicus TaxID=307972 RepID=UPI003AB42A14